MTEAIRSLAARYYTDPQVFKMEKEGLLARTWQFGCHGSELAKIGDYATFEIAGESLLRSVGATKISACSTTYVNTEHTSWSVAQAQPV